MRTDELVAAVRRGASIDTDEHALRAVRATVVVLARRSAAINRLLVDCLSTQITGRLPLLRGSDFFSLGSFYARVSVVEGPACSQRDVQSHVRATVTVLNRCTGGQLGLLIRELPPEFVDLLVEVPVHRSVELGHRAGRPVPRGIPWVPSQRQPLHDQL